MIIAHCLGRRVVVVVSVAFVTRGALNRGAACLCLAVVEILLRHLALEEIKVPSPSHCVLGVVA